MRGSARLASYLARAMIGVGLLLLLVGWNGAASLDYVQGQFPYLISASVPGLALVIVGIAVEYVQMTRELTARRAREMADLDAAMDRLVGFVRDGGALSPAAAAPVELPPAPTPHFEALDTSGHAFTAPARVIAGRSSFHEPTCHLVSSRADMTELTREEAKSRGLAPCRICKP